MRGAKVRRLAGERVLEIRTYRIREGEREEFGRRMSAAAPLLERAGIGVAGQRLSLDDAEHYVLLRSTPEAVEKLAESLRFDP